MGSPDPPEQALWKWAFGPHTFLAIFYSNFSLVWKSIPARVKGVLLSQNLLYALKE
jgi:hypothetical protein